METSLHTKNQFEEVNAVVEEYSEMGYADLIHTTDLKKP